MSTIVKFGASGLAGSAGGVGLVGQAISLACSLAHRERWLLTSPT